MADDDRREIASGANVLPRNCLALDIEIGRRDRIYALAAIRGTESFKWRGGDLAAALRQLDDFADGSEVLLGHNLIRFDIPHLQAANANLRLLRLPMLDTLWLSPLAFPRHPYHHLVKHYQDGQLKRGRVNDPELDARLTLDVAGEQIDALAGAQPNLLTAWHWLTTSDSSGAAFDAYFARLRNAPRPTLPEARLAIAHQLSKSVCLVAGREVLGSLARHGWPLAFALAWLSVAGGNSVMPPWVRHQFADAGALVRRLRDTPCENSGCSWCQERHNAKRELKRWFGYAEFRTKPQCDDGRSMQQAIVEAALGGRHLLGILPTGVGKSLCYQLPALSRYDKTGALTVVISPLVALMADQVAGLGKRGIDSCVTVNGLLSMPERADALDRVRLGDASMLIVAPEQLRSRAVRQTIEQREVGIWVLDEAHCLSKWGHDFRPDYRYVARFIRECEPLAAVLCLTATAKPDVKDDIVQHFREKLSVDLELFDGGSERDNLDFVVVHTTAAEKFGHIHGLLTSNPPDGPSGSSATPGGAIVYCATRRRTEEVAEFLRRNGIDAAHFHAGLSPELKKDVQDRFINGRLPVIVATNAFGMGIDKPDVRLVIHADLPGSLENYLQEAGRAGRDQRAARCVLLYSTDDVERQFSLSARSRLAPREIQAVLRALRNLDRRKRMNGEVIATAGEVLRNEDDAAFERDSATDDSRVRTAISWLEDAELLTREENRTQIFPSSLRVQSIEQAGTKLAAVQGPYRQQLLDIVRALIEADADEGVSTDELMGVCGLKPEGVRKALYDLEDFGIASNDTVLTAYVHHGVRRHSHGRFDETARLERALIKSLQEVAPDMAKGDSQVLHLRVATQQLKDEGHEALPERVRSLLRSIERDGYGDDGAAGSIGLRSLDNETLRVTLNRDWPALAKTANLRRDAAQRLLAHLLDCLAPGSQGTDLLAETTLGKLLHEVKSDMDLKNRFKKPDKLVDRALLWLHEQQIIRLNKGLTIFRPAMSIHLSQDRRRQFRKVDFEPLRLHYADQVLQIHVMAEYAQRGLQQMAAAIRLTMDYFSLKQDEFLRHWMPSQEYSRQTTPESWRRIVETLATDQRSVVADDGQRSALVLAGPGSGKTRVLVHRIAYLVRVRREDPRSIVALAYNRHAAADIRRRLAELIGEDARGVAAYTCHGLAMRLAGASFSAGVQQPNDDSFKDVLREATALLRGDGMPPEEADQQRAQLLAGMRWILVDEFQDINDEQYALIAALAGRTLPDADDKQHLLVVGDDDQNIYSFNGASVKFIRQFEQDYGAKRFFLAENYRSTAHIIEASNALIRPAESRMKSEHPIRPDRERIGEPAGGPWAELDPVAQGRVQLLPCGRDPIAQAQAVLLALQRLAACGNQNWDWAKCAVIAREWRYLQPVRACCELLGIPVQMGNEEFRGLWRVREIQTFIAWLGDRQDMVDADACAAWLDERPPTPWNDLLREALAEHQQESGGAQVPTEQCIEWLAEWSRDVRRRQRGLLLLTAHRAKGLEFDHVVVMDGGWEDRRDDDRRLYYVAMTRARYTLALMCFDASNRLRAPLLHSPSAHSTLHGQPPALSPPTSAMANIWSPLDLKDVDLGFAGSRRIEDPVHRRIRDLNVGDCLELRENERWELFDRGVLVGRLARQFRPPAMNGRPRRARARVAAIVKWDRKTSGPEYRNRYACDVWEVVVPELVFTVEGSDRPP